MKIKIYRGFGDPRLHKKERAVAVGIFDGVHQGHQKIIARVLIESRKRGWVPTVVTFDPHPMKVLRPRIHHPNILMSLAHRLRMFESLGVREAVVIRFDRRFSKVSREIFLRRLLLDRLGMKFLAVGHDFRFGRKALGDSDFLRGEAKKSGFHAAFISPLKNAGQIISSTRIRSLVETGRLAEAKKMLGRPVSVYGTVVRGRGRGKKLGFPTANLNPHHEALPPEGVYAAFGYLGGRKLKGVIHIGARPTFSESDRSLEVHFLNFTGDLYGREIELVFVARLRGIRRFQNPEALTRAIRRDSQKAARLLR